MPVLRALIDKGDELLTIQTHLPNLPKTSQNPTFFDDFKSYVFSEEWDKFMSNIVSTVESQCNIPWDVTYSQL